MAAERTPVVIELNDSEIRVARDTDIVLRSPGYAVLGDGGIEVGESAIRKAWLNPRATQNRYWQQLNLDPLPNPSARARHHADLAYAHLLAIHEHAGKPDEAVFAVPGHYTNEQLALLLGLVEASPFAAVGLVDAAVAAVASRAGRGRHTHAELYLHQVVLTRVEVGEDVVRESVEVVDGTGWARMLEDCANVIADLFIEQSRFDPQHHAETEQALFDQVPRALHALADARETTIEIGYQGTTYLVKVPRDALLAVLQPAYRRLADRLPDGDQVLLGDRLARLPGLAARLQGAQAIPADGLFATCRAQLDRIRSEGSALDFVTRLRAAEARNESAPRPAPAEGVEAAEPPASAERVPAEPAVTHVLCGHRAYPLHRGRLYLDGRDCRVRDAAEGAHAAAWSEGDRVSVQPLDGCRLVLNGEPASAPTTVRAGDRLAFADAPAEYVFIHVQE